MRIAPDPPSGWPTPIAPPSALTRVLSAPVSASHARGTGANASLISNAPISSIDRPERFSTFAVAGMGPVSMTTGSSAATTVVWIRAIGVQPCAAAYSLVVTSSAPAPSEICEEFPAWITPFSLNTVFSFASDSTVPPRRIPSSEVRPATGASCFSKAPESVAAADSSCERSEYSSSRVRESPHFSATISAPIPWLKPSTPNRSSTFGGKCSPFLAALPMGTRLMVSTPPAITTSFWPEITVAAANATACWLDPHARLTVVAGTDTGQPAAKTAVRATIPACSPTWLTQPHTTSSTVAGSRPVRSVRAVSTWADRSTGWISDSAPPRRPMGVRTASTITASRMRCPSLVQTGALFSPSRGPRARR